MKNSRSTLKYWGRGRLTKLLLLPLLRALNEWRGPVLVSFNSEECCWITSKVKDNWGTANAMILSTLRHQWNNRIWGCVLHNELPAGKTLTGRRVFFKVDQEAKVLQQKKVSPVWQHADFLSYEHESLLDGWAVSVTPHLNWRDICTQQFWQFPTTENPTFTPPFCSDWLVVWRWESKQVLSKTFLFFHHSLRDYSCHIFVCKTQCTAVSALQERLKMCTIISIINYRLLLLLSMTNGFLPHLGVHAIQTNSVPEPC